MAAINQGMPTPGYPMVDNTGKISPVWFQFLVSLYNRTGGGSNSGTIQSITFVDNNGVIASISNTGGVATITLGLGDITPNSITTTSGVFSANLRANNIQFGAFTGGGLSSTGYITITDNGGIPRRLLVG